MNDKNRIEHRTRKSRKYKRKKRRITIQEDRMQINKAISQARN
jgi:hypothetical protein